MNTMQAECRTDITRLAEDMANRAAEAAREANRMREDVAKRDKDNLRWTITLVLGCAAVVIGAFALLA